MDRLSLPALLSFAVVAFTIEFDNEAELQLPHSTTRHGATAGAFYAPWLVSMAMYLNCMRYVNEEGIPLRELQRLARTPTNLDGMQRWGYIVAVPSLDHPLPRFTRSKPRPDWIILPTAAGRVAQQIWQPLFEVIEARWRDRFGIAVLASIRASLQSIVRQLDPALPDCLPILGYGLTPSTNPRTVPAPSQLDLSPASELPLPVLLAKILLAFAIEFESQSQLSLAISANVLRIAENPILIRDLPRFSGASKEAIAVAVGFLSRHGYASIAPLSPGSRNKALVLTPSGQAARQAYLDIIPAIESSWRCRFGGQAIDQLHSSLQNLIAESPEELLPLMRGLDPQPGNWRSKLPKPKTLPHYPLVLHRGGYPDGS